ncbi:MAG: histone [Promethearchaeota archaeon]
MAKKKRIFAWSPLRNLMKTAGAEIVSRDAVEVLLDFLEKRAKSLTETALVFAKHSKRKKINSADLELAIETL